MPYRPLLTFRFHIDEKEIKYYFFIIIPKVLFPILIPLVIRSKDDLGMGMTTVLWNAFFSALLLVSTTLHTFAKEKTCYKESRL